MDRRFIRLLFVIVGGTLGISYLPQLWQVLKLDEQFLTSPLASFVNMFIGIILFYLLSLVMMDWVFVAIRQAEKRVSAISVSYIIFGLGGLIAGLVAAWLIGIPVSALQIPAISQVAPLLLSVGFGYLGVYVATTRMDEIRKMLQFNKRKKNDDSVMLERKADDHFRKYKLLDTSVIIDGRIYDIAKTGFIEGVLVIPSFVLVELQYIADSADSLKRVRGRRGLDILNALQKEEGIAVEMYDGDYEDIQEVDLKLIRLAKALDGIIVTNDYNLNKVSEFQNVPVLNINALANAVKPIVIPGETLRTRVVKSGTERQQGVAYLDDGTMIVVEDGQHYMDQEIEVVVTSALQTAAGRMIFAKPLHSQKKINQ